MKVPTIYVESTHVRFLQVGRRRPHLLTTTRSEHSARHVVAIIALPSHFWCPEGVLSRRQSDSVCRGVARQYSPSL